ncbi:hypothetical protein FHS74_004694 [Nitrospirillum iridis]|uniref:Uncharacterized protein n=1 Tax=Nitrospirillum iridis TaxID=765888 RepID=A0A7X0B314_9PROT|nr:hypothetical protein [Nitrospirillum iridis]
MGDVLHFRPQRRGPVVRLLPPVPSTAAALQGLLRDMHADVAEFNGQPGAAAALASYANRLRIIIAHLAGPGGAA